MTLPEMASQASKFAIAAHGDQRRRYTGAPYWHHLQEVAVMVGSTPAGEDPEVIVAAWLHDTLEDTPVQALDIERAFGPRVREMVEALTEPAPAPGLNRARRKTIVRERLARAPAKVQTIKTADLISNAASIREHDPRFWAVFRAEANDLLACLQDADPRLHAAARAAFN